MKIKKVFLIPHFHFDFEWWKEEPHHEEDAVIIIEKALEMLEKHPNFTYVIDQILPLKFFLEKNPDRKQEIQKLLDNKRLELVGGGLVAPDENLPTGEGLIRQFSQGKQWLQENFDYNVEVGWEIDEFGHPAQIPQILSLLGFKYFVFSRGMNPYDKDHPTLFWWKDPPIKNKLLTYWLAAHYICGAPSILSSKITKEKFFKEIEARIQYERKRSPVPSLMFPLGGDFTMPFEDWIDLVNMWNKEHDIQLEFSIPSIYFGSIEKKSLAEIQGEFNPVFTGCYSSREKLKKRCREIQYQLTFTEKLCTLSTLLGNKYPEQKFKNAWWEVLKGDFHDTICGTGTDRVYRKSLERYDKAEYMLGECEKQAVTFLQKKLKNDVFVFSPLNWEREEVVETDNGYEIARVPALGITRLKISNNKYETVKVSRNKLENKYVRVVCNEQTGLISIYDKEKNVEVISGAGNEIIVENDVGNLWTTTITGKKHRLRCKGIEIKKNTPHIGSISIKEGNKFIDIEKDITLYSNKKRVDFNINIDFKGKDKRIDVCFPFSFDGKWLGEEPFHVVNKENGTWAFQNVALYCGKNYITGIVNKGIPGHYIQGNNCRLILFRSVSLFSPQLALWCIKNIAKIVKCVRKTLSHIRDNLNIAEFAMYPIHNLLLREWATGGDIDSFGTMNLKSHLHAHLQIFKEALCWERGKHRFEYSLLLDVKNIEDGVKQGLEINNPLWIKKIKGSGHMTEFRLFRNDVKGVIISGIQPHKNGFLLRCYEVEGKEKKVVFPLNANITKAYRLDSNETLSEIPLAKGDFSYKFKPGEIVQFLLVK